MTSHAIISNSRSNQKNLKDNLFTRVAHYLDEVINNAHQTEYARARMNLVFMVMISLTSLTVAIVYLLD